jgi:DEAD/DEAH box helicase domain-containing protein
VFLNDDEVIDETTQHQRWRFWLWLFNTFQTIPGFVLATERGVQAGDYASLAPVSVPVPAAQGLAATLQGVWQSVLDGAVVDVLTGIQRLMAAGVEPPHVGYEHADDRGIITAEAELAWPQFKLCVLTDSQVEFTETWTNVGWTASTLSDDWVQAVLGFSKVSTN